MELQRIKDLVESKGKTGLVDIPFTEIEPLLDDNVDFPDKKNRFKMKLKPELSNMGLDFMMIGNTVRFTVKESKKSKAPNPPMPKTTPKAVEKPVETVNKPISQAVENPVSNGFDDFLQFADEDPGLNTDFGHDYIFPAEFKFIKAAVETSGCHPLLVGDKSTGKSRMGEEIGKQLDRHDWEGNVIGRGIPCVRVNLEEIEEAPDFVGSPQLITNPQTQTSETVYIPGILLEAWVKGYILVLEEIDRSSKAARKQLNTVTEQGGKLMVPTHRGFKFFRRHPDCRLIFTANTWGHGDFSGMYDGAEPLNTAWLSRIGPKFEIKTDWEVFKRVLHQYNLPEKVIHLLFEKDGGAVQNMHAVIKQSRLQESIALRSFIRFAKLYKIYGWHLGLETCVINEFTEHNRQKMRDAITSKLTADFEPTANFDTIKSEKVQSALRREGL